MEFEHKIGHVVPQKCPVCEAEQSKLTSLPIGQTEDRMIVHVRCECCKNALMVFVTQNDVGVMTFGVMVDVDEAEAQTMFGQKAIDYDDVIEVHRFLQDKNMNVQDIVQS